MRRKKKIMQTVAYQPLFHLIMQVISGHLGWVRSIAFDPSNKWFCTGSADRTIKVLNFMLHLSKLAYLSWFMCYCYAVRETQVFLFPLSWNVFSSLEVKINCHLFFFFGLLFLILKRKFLKEHFWGFYCKFMLGCVCSDFGWSDMGCRNWNITAFTDWTYWTNTRFVSFELLLVGLLAFGYPCCG